MPDISGLEISNAVVFAQENESEWLRLAMMAARIGTWEWDIPTGKLKWSDNLEAMHGMAPGTFDGTLACYLQALHPEDREAFQQTVQQALDTGSEFDAECRVLLADGNIRWVSGKGRAFYDEAGRPYRMIGVGMDITERRQAEETLRQSEERLRIFAEAMPQIAWVADAVGKVEYVNRRWTEYSGQTAEETGPHNDGVIHPDDAPIMWQRWQESLQTGTSYEVEFRCRRASDGTYRWFLARGVPVRNEAGCIVRWIGTSTDIHALKQAEDEIARLNARMHRAVYESTHRIKNQLQLLAATVDMALMDGEEFISADHFRRLSAQIRTLSVLQDILTVEWKSDTSGSRETISIRTMLEQILKMLRQTTGSHRLNFQIEETFLPVRAVTTLALITNEAVANAMKHGREETQVTYQVQNDMGCLEIEDDGSGFPVDFDPKSAANTGLELISSLVTYDLRGTVCYGNRPQGGGRVVVTFPLSTTS